MPLLRGHHLICLHFFNGEGYDPAFIENMKNILKGVADREVEICPGADDICKHCPYLKHERCQYSQDTEKEINVMDKKALDLLSLTEGMKIEWNTIKNMIPDIFLQWYRYYCVDCDWKEVCEKNEFFRRIKFEKRRNEL